MRLTRIERWTLANQFAIRGMLEPENSDYFEQARDTVESGYEGMYEDFCNVSADGDVLTTGECTEVYDILSMYDMLKLAYDQLPDKSGIAFVDIKFEGFDGNHDKQFGFTRLLAKQGKYQDVLGGSAINSHSTVLPMYQRKLVAWEASADKYALTKEDFIRVAGA